jgi:tungstate transport system substrate-binding protein
MRPDRIALTLAGVLILALLSVCWVYALGLSDGDRTLVLATTTSVEDSGLLQALLPSFEAIAGCEVRVVAVGSGQALRLGRTGDVDALLVHAPADEEAFLSEGHGLARRPVMWNDFVLVGPPGDPAGLEAAVGLEDAFHRLAAAGRGGRALFLSRGDGSGTNVREKTVWSLAGIEPAGAWYQETGSGMGDTLRMAAERGAYTLADRATFLSHFPPGSQRLMVLFEGDVRLVNQYSLIVVSPERHPGVNARLAELLAAYLVSEEARAVISAHGTDRAGSPLFHPGSAGESGR